MHKAFQALLVALALALPSGAGAQEVQQFSQIALSEKQVEGFVGARKELAAMAEKLPKGPGNKPDPKVIEELEGIAKKHGFATFKEFGDVAANIGIIKAGLDPKTKAFSEPPEVIKKEIEELKADTSLPAKEKEQIVQALNEALKRAEPIKHRENIELVKKNYERLDAVLQ
jgi:hypothetical protein